MQFHRQSSAGVGARGPDEPAMREPAADVTGEFVATKAAAAIAGHRHRGGGAHLGAVEVDAAAGVAKVGGAGGPVEAATGFVEPVHDAAQLSGEGMIAAADFADASDIKQQA